MQTSDNANLEIFGESKDATILAILINFVKVALVQNSIFRFLTIFSDKYYRGVNFR